MTPSGRTSAAKAILAVIWEKRRSRLRGAGPQVPPRWHPATYPGSRLLQLMQLRSVHMLNMPQFGQRFSPSVDTA